MPLRPRPRQHRHCRGYMAQLQQPSFEGRDGRNLWHERKDFAIDLADGTKPLQPAISPARELGGHTTTTYQDKPQPLLFPRAGRSFSQPPACLRLPAGRQQLPGNSGPILALRPSASALRPSCHNLMPSTWNPSPKRASKPSRGFKHIGIYFRSRNFQHPPAHM